MPRTIGRRSRRWRLQRRVEREARDLDLAERGLLGRALALGELLGGRLAHGDRPVGDAAHHHALEHRLAADRRVALGAELAVAPASARSPTSAPFAAEPFVEAPYAASVVAAGIVERTGRPGARTSRYCADRLRCVQAALGHAALEALDAPAVSISFCRPV